MFNQTQGSFEAETPPLVMGDTKFSERAVGIFFLEDLYLRQRSCSLAVTSGKCD